MQARRAADEIIYAEIDRRRSNPSATDAGGGDVLGALLAAQDDADGALTDEEVRDQVVSLIAAGFDTTAAAIAWTMHSILVDQRVHRRLRTEIDETVGDEPLTSAHLGEMTYLDAVVSESLRLHPPPDR